MLDTNKTMEAEHVVSDKDGKGRVYKYKFISASIKEADGTIIFESDRVEVPVNWSQTACDILAQKYFRKTGVPVHRVQIEEEGMQPWFWRSEPIADTEFTGETSAHDVFHRIAGCWTYWGIKAGYFTTNKEADSFYGQVYYALYHQIVSPNSPQWFNTGLHWAYGISRKVNGASLFHLENGKVVESEETYVHPQVHACYILSIEDKLLGGGGIMDLFTREAAVFKYGSGAGTNYSAVRGVKEKLVGGGYSSGLMSFLKIGDTSAGSIKSGGTTRRAARMVVLDDDHPEIEDFVTWKMREENKVAALITGSQLNKKLITAIVEASTSDALELALAEAVKYNVPSGLIARANQANLNGYKLDLTEFDTHWEGEAYQTVSGQNANNSISMSDAFMQAVMEDRDWNLTARTDGSVIKVIKARKLWDDVVTAAWCSADPGVHFNGHMNAWNTVSNDGRIKGTNPCSEYIFLDDTACNLASINLVAVYREANSDMHEFGKKLEEYSRLFQTVLDISIEMAQFVSEAMAKNTYEYRTTGLGYANLGSLIMRLGMAYGDEQSQLFTSLVTSIMTGAAYSQSAKLAKKLGSFPAFERNREPFLKVIRKHWDAHNGLEIHMDSPFGTLFDRGSTLWTGNTKETKYRNAQTTVIAPTGTIGLVMDCDTTGIEPDFSLIKHKKLAGGGYMKLLNTAVPEAMIKLGYTEQEINQVEHYLFGYGHIPESSNLEMISRTDLWSAGIENELIETLDCSKYHSIVDVINFLADKSGVDLSYMIQSPALVHNTQDFVYGHGTIEGCDIIKPEHLRVFACAVAPKNGTLEITPMEHLSIVAAAQPFISGGASKTINMPQSATMADISEVYMEAYKKEIKCVSVYRDGSKLSQPLMTSLAMKIKKILETTAPNEPQPTVERIVEVVKEVFITGQRHKIPSKRRGYTQKVRIDGQSFYLRTGEYADGKLGEVFIDVNKEGAGFRAMMNNFAIAISIGLQYGVPLEEFVEAFIFTKFEPAGMVLGHDNIKSATSIMDYIFRDLAFNYLQRDDLVHVKPDRSVETMESPFSTPQPIQIAGAVKLGDWRKVEGTELEGKTIPDEVITIEKTTTIKQEVKVASAHTGDMCGHCKNYTLVRTGTCFTCSSCGETTGCA